MTTDTATGGPIALPLRSVRIVSDAVQLRWNTRSVVVSAVLVVLIALIACITLTSGSYSIPLGKVIPAVVGIGDRYDVYFIQGQRLPRIALAILIGAALGISGALFQSIASNALGSPDVIGFTAGSATGAVVVVTLLNGSLVQVSIGAVIGGLVTAALIYLLAMRQGVHGYRLVLVGIGFTALLGALNGYLLIRSAAVDVQSVTLWLVGNLHAGSSSHVLLMQVALLIGLPLALATSRPLSLIEMGPASAASLGVNVRWHQAVALIVGTGLVAVGTASVGPISFVALAAPHVARSLTRGVGLNIVATALTGALLLSVSDLLAERLFAPFVLPVGLVTVVLGGGYLILMLFRRWGAETA